MASEAPLKVEAVVTPVKEVTKADTEVTKECKEKPVQTNGTENGAGDAPVANGKAKTKETPTETKEELNDSKSEDKEATKRPAEDKTEEQETDETKKAKLDENTEKEAAKPSETKEEQTTE